MDHLVRYLKMDIQRDRPKNRQMNRGTARGDYLESLWINPGSKIKRDTSKPGLT